MAEAITVARPYAQAVFETAKQASRLKEWLAVLEAGTNILAEPLVVEHVKSPNIDPEKLYGFMAGLVEKFSAPLDKAAQNFLRILIENKRLELLPHITSVYKKLCATEQSRADAMVESAFPLSDQELSALGEKLSRRFNRTITPTLKVNPKLVGGVRVTVGDVVIDGSVRARLTELNQQLLSQY